MVTSYALARAGCDAEFGKVAYWDRTDDAGNRPRRQHAVV
jgi:hypothetical protein